jgi:hypothetical protein
MNDPATYPITVQQGTVWRRRVTLRTGSVETNSPIDLTGHTLHAQVREVWSADAFQAMAIENIDAEAGAFDLVLDDRPRTLRKAKYHWDLLLTPPDGEPKKILEGPLRVKFTITRIPS